MKKIILTTLVLFTTGIVSSNTKRQNITIITNSQTHPAITDNRGDTGSAD